MRRCVRQFYPMTSYYPSLWLVFATWFSIELVPTKIRVPLKHLCNLNFESFYLFQTKAFAILYLRFLFPWGLASFETPLIVPLVLTRSIPFIIICFNLTSVYLLGPGIYLIGLIYTFRTRSQSPFCCSPHLSLRLRKAIQPSYEHFSFPFK